MEVNDLVDPTGPDEETNLEIEDAPNYVLNMSHEDSNDSLPNPQFES